MTDEWRLNSALIEVEERKGYLYVRVHGEISTVAEVERAVDYVRARMDQVGTKKLHLDARQLRLPLPDDACHAAWQFIHGKHYTTLACTLPEDGGDLMVTRMNMTGVSSGLPFRAFSNIVEAHRWLELRPSGIRRVSTMSLPAMSSEASSARTYSTGTMAAASAAASAAPEVTPTSPPPPSIAKKPPSIPPLR